MKLHLPLSLRYIVLTGLLGACSADAAVGSSWDPAWGAAGLAGAPNAADPQYAADISTDGVTALVAPPDGSSPYDFGTYTAITLNGAGNSGAIIVGGASATQSTATGAVVRNSWIAAESGTYNLLVGGSYADNWSGGAVFNFTGDSHILVDGATVANIMGGNYKDGLSAAFTGNSYISVVSGNVTGSIVGATVVAHDRNSEFNGDTHVYVYVPLSDYSGPAINQLPANMVMGGFGWATNTRKTQTLNGSTHVTVDLSDYSGPAAEFAKHIVGGGFSGSSANSQLITGDTHVSVNLGNCTSSARVVGGMWVNSGRGTIEGSTILSISGGTFNNRVVGGSWTDVSGTTTNHGDINLSLTGGTFNSEVLGATYITTGDCTMTAGQISIDLTGNAVLNSPLTGGYSINGTASAAVNATLGDVSITLNGATVSDVVGGSYTQRNRADAVIAQGAIDISLLSGTLQGNVYAAGQQDGSTSMQTAATTVTLAPALTVADGVTLSGGYGGTAVSSTVSGWRTLVFSPGSYNVAGVSFVDFDAVQVADATDVALSSFTSDSRSLTKSGKGSLSLAAHSDFTDISVQGGSLALSGGVSATALQSLTMAAGTSLAGVQGTITAGTGSGTVLNLALSTDNVGANAAGTPLITGTNASPANLTLTGAQDVTIDLSAEGLMDLLLEHRNQGDVTSYLTLVDGELTCANPAQLGINTLLNTYGLRAVGAADGSLLVNGTTEGIYFVTADASTTDPHEVTTYPTLGLYAGVVIDAGQQLTINLPGDDDATTRAVVNNLMGAADSLLTVQNSSGSGTVTVLLSNRAVDDTGDAAYPSLPARTVMQGSISAGAGTELIKSGSGELVVEGNLSAEVLGVQDGTLSLNGADNTVTTLQLSAGILQLGSGSSLVVQNSSGSGTVSIASGGSLLLDNVNAVNSAWNIDNQGNLTANVATSRNLTLGTLTLSGKSVNTLVMDTDGPVNNSLSLRGLRVQPGTSRVQLVSTGARLLRSGEYVIGSVGSTDVQGSVQLSLSGLPFAQLLSGESYLYVDGGNIVLHAERSPQNLLLSAADSPNSAAGAQLLWNAEPTEHGDLSRAYAELQQLIASGQGAAARRAMAAVAGSSLAVMGPALSEDVERQLRSIRNRTASMGVNPCVVNENMPYCNFWVQAEGDYRHLSAAGDSPGYKFQRWGGTAGMDVDFNPAITAGLAVTGLYGELSSDSPDTLDCDVSSWYLSAFARYQDRPWVHTFIATLGWVNADPERRVQVGGMQYRTEGSTSGHSFGFMYELAYNWQPDSSDPSFTLQPLLNISYRHSSLSGYTERGSDAALHVEPQSMDALRLSLGARLQSLFGENIFNRSSVFEFRALLGMDIGDRRGHADVALVNGSGHARVQSARPGAFGAELGMGLAVPIGAESGTLFLDGSVLLRSHESEFHATVGYRIRF